MLSFGGWGRAVVGGVGVFPVVAAPMPEADTPRLCNQADLAADKAMVTRPEATRLVRRKRRAHRSLTALRNRSSRTVRRSSRSNTARHNNRSNRTVRRSSRSNTARHNNRSPTALRNSPTALRSNRSSMAPRNSNLTALRSSLTVCRKGCKACPE